LPPPPPHTTLAETPCETSDRTIRLYDQIVPPGLSTDGAIELQGPQDGVAWYRQKRVVQEDLDLSRVVDNQHVENALQQLGPY